MVGLGRAGCRSDFPWVNSIPLRTSPSRTSSLTRLPFTPSKNFSGSRHEGTQPTISPSLLPILMLFASNVFMTFAWYGHLKFKESPLPLVVLASWGIAFVEYWLAVPANRWGSAVYSAAQLKTMQEVITLVVFACFSVLYLKEPLGWNHALGFLFIAVGAFLIFHKWA